MTWWDDEVMAMLGERIATPEGMRDVSRALGDVEITTEAGAVEVIAAAESLKAAAAAAQVRATAVLDLLRRSREQINGVAEARQGLGLAEEVALARKESPSTGYRRLKAARVLVDDLPRALAAMEAGELSDDRAHMLAGEVTELSRADRRVVDAELGTVVGSLSDRQLRDRTRRVAQRLDAEHAARRAEAARRTRRVTVRPAGEPGMAFLTAHLPVGDARRVYESLTREADQILHATTPAGSASATDSFGVPSADGTGDQDGVSGAADRTGASGAADGTGAYGTDGTVRATDAGEAADRTGADGAAATSGVAGRSRSQLVADLFVERVTGTGASQPRDVELTLVMTDQTLLGGDEPGWVPGQGPVPAPVARGLLTPDLAGDVELRRIWSEPVSGRVTKMDVRSRVFSARLRRMLLVRDDRCRQPFCGAPILQIDHATRWADGGATELANASGLCQRCNLAKENPGWSHTATETTLIVTTPTGHQYIAAPSHLARLGPAGAGDVDDHERDPGPARNGSGRDRRPPDRPVLGSRDARPEQLREHTSSGALERRGADPTDGGADARSADDGGADARSADDRPAPGRAGDHGAQAPAAHDLGAHGRGTHGHDTDGRDTDGHDTDDDGAA
ncbi:MAG: DUF222 domain-containing protein [Actinomycetaceae bacterium]